MAFDPARCLTAEAPADAVALRPITPEQLGAWRENAPAAQRRWAERSGFAARKGEVLILPGGDGPEAALVGLGEGGRAEDPDAWLWAGVADKLPAGRYRLPADLAEEAARHAALGWALTQYRFDRYAASAAGAPKTLAVAGSAHAYALAMAEAVGFVRDLVNTPTNDMGPAELAAAAEGLAAEFGASCTLTVGEDLLAQNFPAVHAVGRASDQAPRLIDLSWGDANAPKLTLVGKGVCFDSGGLNIKSGSGMRLMKKDMGGAAHALGLARLVMQSALPVRLRVLVPAVENAVSGRAFRPGDIIATRKGLSVEIGNTDAEGRLVLADALALACEDTPDLILDFATLTGAARVALGGDIPALFTPDHGLADALARAAGREGDPLWRLPLWQPYLEDLSSPVADIVNCTEGGFAGAVTAALFLSRFVEPSIAWAHLDIYAWNQKTRPGRPAGGEAMALRAAFSVLEERYRKTA